MHILIIDNYDSFTFNLYQLAGEITGTPPTVIHNDGEWEALAGLQFDAVIISPGPGRPEREMDFGLSARAIRELDVPLLGVCLGQQGICHAFGGSVVHAPEPMHGRLSAVHHDGAGLFANVPTPFSAMRYHSLACAQPLPDELRATAWTADGVVMSVAHRSRPIWGVQFHPESVATEHGAAIVANFVEMARAFWAKRNRLSVRRIPIKVDAPHLFAVLFAHLDHAFWLDSSLHSDGLARFSFLGGANAAEAETLCYRHGDEGDVLSRLKRQLRARQVPAADLPFDFNCGYVGYFGYELKALCGAPSPFESNLPDCYLLFVDRCVVIDHQTDEVYLLCLGDQAAQWFDRIALHLHEGPSEPGPSSAEKPPFTMRHSREQYLDQIRQCLEYIREGESYELCLTNQLSAPFAGDPLAYYNVLRRLNPAPYAAYLKLGGVTVCCSSPERFLRVRPGGAVESKPIKGTIRRGTTDAEDEELRQRLQSDVKNQAENLMIVDLLRNDLGRVCEIGSVGVPALMQVETYATVHQLVSTITGQLRGDCTAVDCLRAAFPGGSMTGAPKLRSMALLDELEQQPRGVYSGSIGYFGLNGSADLNIVIRTAVFANGQVTIGAGGAIVAQSDPEEEWQEVLLKAQALLSAFGSQ